VQHIRNFAIIAHIDHGKTTLTDSLLRLTGALSERESRERIMDSNPIEQERGITIKLAPVRMDYHHKGQTYQLNLIDTPGHVDFGYEVTRSLAAAEGALLLIDATQGVQAQTLTNFEKAQQLGLTIIPVINKIDLPAADPEAVMLECMETFGFAEDEIVSVSAKTGLHVDRLLEMIVARIPAPSVESVTKAISDDASLPVVLDHHSDDQPENNSRLEAETLAKSDVDQSQITRALIMTSQFDQHRGVVAYVRVVSGELAAKQSFYLAASESTFQPLEVGIFTPSMKAVPVLRAGEVGYVSTGIKDIRQVRVGDTLTQAAQRKQVLPLPGFKVPQPMVYMELFPIDADEFPQLQDAMQKLSLHDAALVATGTHSPALGNGLRVGFLGILHGEIVLERLRREFDLDLIATAPTVTYSVTFSDGTESLIRTPAEMPDPSQIKALAEPMTIATVFTPVSYAGTVLQLVQERRGMLLNSINIGTRVKLRCEIPLAELITDFHDRLKSISSGFASLEYELAGYREIDAVKISVLVAGELIEALSVITVREQAEYVGRQLVARLKEVVPRQLFEVPIQAAIGGKIIARETIKAYRKDVTAKLYGGDVTRRQKLLKKQAKGKKRLKQFGRVELNQEAFLAVLKR